MTPGDSTSADPTPMDPTVASAGGEDPTGQDGGTRDHRDEPTQDDDRTIATSGIGRLSHSLLVAVVAAAAGVVTFVASYPMGLVDDDVTNLRLVDGAASFLDPLLYPVFFTQVAPGHRLLSMLQVAVGPLDRVVLHAVVAAMVALCVVVGSAIMRHMYGRQVWGPVVVGLALVSPAVIQANVWYASAHHQTPSLLFGLAAVWAWLVHRERGGRRWLLLSVVLVGCGLAFSVRAALAVVFMLLAEHVLFTPTPLGDVPGRVWAARRTWLPYLVPLFVYWQVNRAAGTLDVGADAGLVVAAIARGVVEVFVPLLFGLRTAVDASGEVTTPTEVVLLAHALLAVVVVLLARRRRDAWRGIGVALVMVVVGLGLSTAARSAVLGSVSGLTLRYHMEPLVYAAMALPWALRGRRDQQVSGWLDRPLVPRATTTSAVALAVGVVAATTWSGLAVVDAFPGAASARWLEAVAASADDAGPTLVLDGPLDAAVQPNFPRRRFNDVAWLYEDVDVGLATPTGVDDLEVVTVNGSIEPLRTEELFSQVGADYAVNGLVSTDGDLVTTGTRACTSSTMRLTAVVAPYGAPRIMEVEMAGPASLRVELPPTGPDVPSQPAAETVTSATMPVAVVPMDLFGDVFGVGLEVTARSGVPACVTRVRFLAVDNELPATTLDAG